MGDMLVVNKLETIIAIARMKMGTFGTAFTNRWRRSPRDSTPTAVCRPAVPVPSPSGRCRFASDGQHVLPSGTCGDTSVIIREDSTPSILEIVTVQSAALWPVNFPLRRSIVGRGILCDQRALGIRRFALYQLLKRNR
jgi:hypothetical protein